ncbi:hypothetical protein BTVI_157115 [Pitangus sulphuratus]|nr:hypothetical protein BTVI_157115 [Pitangus sulphuratus]
MGRIQCSDKDNNNVQALHQLHCLPLDSLQHLNVLPELRGPELDTILKVLPHLCQVQWKNHFPGPAGHTITDTRHDAIGLLGHLGTPLAHVQLPVNQYSQVLFHWAALQPLCPQPVALQRVVEAKAHNPALGLVEPHAIGLSPSIQPVQVPVQRLSILQQIQTLTKLGIVHKFADGRLNPLIQIANKDTKQDYPQDSSLGDTTSDQMSRCKLEEIQKLMT